MEVDKRNRLLELIADEIKRGKWSVAWKELS